MLEAAPGDAEALSRVETLLERTERWSELASFYEDGLGADGPEEEQVRLLTALAEVAESRLGDTPHAIGELQRLCELRPRDLNALR